MILGLLILVPRIIIWVFESKCQERAYCSIIQGMKNDFNGQKIAVIGAGVEGLSSEKWLVARGAEVIVLDKNDGEDYLKGLDQYDLIVRSPGVKLSVIQEALGDKKVEITSQIKLFFDLCPSKIIGVTGTKGKGTTSSLIYEMLKVGGRDAYLGGNIGKPPFEFLDQLTADSMVVLELSSFQLLDLEKSPHIAVMLMTTSEHLDWHKDVYEYVDAKRNIFNHQTADDFAIVNRDYPASNESDIHTIGKVFQVSREGEVQENGCFVKDGTVIVRREGIDEEIIKTEAILLPGQHNFENVCAAVMAATLAGVPNTAITKVLREFKGLEHRLELIATIQGVRYYDDSFSTTPETAIAAIQAFTDSEILILGGSSKNSDFGELGEVIRNAKNIKAIIGIGVEWEKIKDRLQSISSEVLVIEGAKDMKTIVAAVHKIAEPEDVVILSPACASFDMFKNYKDRGEQFKREVLSLQ